MTSEKVAMAFQAWGDSCRAPSTTGLGATCVVVDSTTSAVVVVAGALVVLTVVVIIAVVVVVGAALVEVEAALVEVLLISVVVVAVSVVVLAAPDVAVANEAVDDSSSALPRSCSCSRPQAVTRIANASNTADSRGLNTDFSSVLRTAALEPTQGNGSPTKATKWGMGR